MMNIYVIAPEIKSKLLQTMVECTIEDKEIRLIEDAHNLPDLKHTKIIFAVELDDAGFYTPTARIISALRERGNDSMFSSEAVLLIHSSSELNTKWAAQNIIFQCNMLGCSFIGHPMVESTVNLSNFKSWQKTLNCSLEEICSIQCEKLGRRFFHENKSAYENPTLAILHASSSKTSNTLALWSIVKSFLFDKYKIIELHVENGHIQDCAGCSFNTCIHYGAQKSCFYGGVMVEEIYPAIEKANSLIWICPNYNDAVSANLMAVINRITALYRQLSFHEKYIFSIIISGNSGSDSVARQLIGALNINKGFRLPPYFSLMSTANDPGSICKVPNIDNIAKEFSFNIIKTISG